MCVLGVIVAHYAQCAFQGFLGLVLTITCIHAVFH